MRHWRSLNPLSIVLMPLAGLFWLAVSLRRWMYMRGWLVSIRLGVPVVVVGNITAGGTGKTPLVIALVKAFQRHGYRPGVVSRGYGGVEPGPRLVTADSDPGSVGDEPVLIAWKTGVPVVVGRDRVAAARLLLANSPGIDLIVSDDGLQHYRLGRSLELAVVDGAVGFGNGLPLPAGPLREPAGRLRSADAVIVTCRQGQTCQFNFDHRRLIEVHHGAGQLYRLKNAAERKSPRHAFVGSIDAVAGIAQPENFFTILRDCGLDIHPCPFPDHHQFAVTDLVDKRIVVMTEKDAVKCRKFAQPDWWALEWNAYPANELTEWLAEAMR
ncbi:MAG: tetraacyldisaccharide 4'-kinase [Thiobacillaceae bacterium]